MRPPRLWVKLTIAEPFPVLFGHVTYDPDTYSGPFYSANSAWYHQPADRDFTEWQAKGLRDRGYTVTVEEVSLG